MRYTKSKLSISVLCGVFGLSMFIGATNADDTVTVKNAEALVEWKAEAIKGGTDSSLSVVAKDKLNFMFDKKTAEAGAPGFSETTGNFNVTVSGNHQYHKTFKLEAHLDDTNNTLRYTETTVPDPDSKAAKLVVGARYNPYAGVSGKGEEVKNSSEDQKTMLLDSQDALLQQNRLKNLAKSVGSKSANYAASSDFTFKINRAVDDNNNDVAFEDLPDGTWTGTVGMRFYATWE